jgi:8-oxo-dGTP diphosphatase
MSPEIIEIALAIVHRHDRWLVAKRPAHVHLGGQWEFPGGKLENGERAEQAALREVAEECGVTATAERLLPAEICHYPERSVRLTPVVCRWTGGDARPLASDEVRWVTLSEVDTLDMPAVNAKIIAQLTTDDGGNGPGQP